MLTPVEIRNKTFNKSFGGYKTDEVDQFLEEISRTVEELTEENSDLQSKLEVLADKLEEYRDDEESLRAALLGAQKLGDSVIKESKNKADIILRDASVKSEKMIDSAKRQLEREQLNLGRMQKEVASFKNRLMSLYKQHLELISALPEEDPKYQESEEKNKPQPEPEQSEEKKLQTDTEQVAAEARPQEPTGEIVEQEEPSPRQSSLHYEMDEEDEDKTEPFVKTSRLKEAPPAVESKFGPLKFGIGYDLTRDDEKPSKRKK